MSCLPCGSTITCRGTQPPGEQGQLGWWQVPVNPVQSIAVCTFNTLRELVTSAHSAPLVSKPPSSTEVDHLSSKKSQRSAIPLSYTITCTIRLSLEKGEPCLQALLQTGRQSNLVMAHPKRCAHHQACRSELDRQTDTSQTPKDAALPSYTHRGQNISWIGPTDNADGEWFPFPWSKAKEVSRFRPVLRSQACLNLRLEHAPETPGDSVSRDLVPGHQPHRKWQEYMPAYELSL